MSFFRLWFLGIINPSEAFDQLRKKPAPAWGFWAILVRFIVTSLTSILALYLLDRRPFVDSYLTFLSAERYYAAEVFFLPVFGLAGWVLSSGVVHVILRLAGRESDFDWIWLLDWITIGLDVYGEGLTPAIHALISVWEVALFGLGLSKMEPLRFWPACLLGLVVKAGVYIPLAMIFVR